MQGERFLQNQRGVSLEFYYYLACRRVVKTVDDEVLPKPLCMTRSTTSVHA
jgi:hypothetical protein